MVVRVTHSKVSGKPQGSDPARVYGTHWDEDHVIEGLTPGVDVQPHDATLDALSGKALLGTGDIVLSSTLAGYQPLDSDLTAIAALTTTTYGRALLTLADAAALAAEVDSFFLTPTEGNAAYQPLDSDLTAIAALSTTSYGRAFLALVDAPAARTALALGTAATQNTGTSGGNVPLLNGANTWSLTQTYTLAPVFTDQSGSRTALGLGTAATQNTGTSGANLPFLNGTNTWASAQTFTTAPVFTDQSGSRTALGLGTSATQNTGTSGATVPFLNGTNTWANAQTFTTAPVFTDQSGSRTALGLGTAATQNTGTSGATVPLLNGANVHSGAVEFSTSIKLTNTSTPAFANGVGTAYVSATNGLILRGQGSTNDLTFMGSGGGTAFTLPNGTSNIAFPNAIQMAVLNNLANTVNLLVRSGTDTRLGNNNVYIADGGTVTIVPGTATPAGGSTNVRLVFGSTAGFGIYIGSGAPSVSAAQGSLYLRSDGTTTNNRAYINTNGSTTWTAITTVA